MGGTDRREPQRPGRAEGPEEAIIRFRKKIAAGGISQNS